MAPRDGSDYLDSDLLGEREAEDVGSPPRARPHVSSSSVRRRARPTTTTASKDARIVIGIDFGTTYTGESGCESFCRHQKLTRIVQGVAFARTQSSTAKLEDIEVIQNWTSKMSNQHKVQSVYSYSKPKQREAQWGSDISEDAITMVNVKLELQPQETRLDELESLLGVLQGTANLSFANLRKIGSNPAYPTKTPTGIITDYLTKICERACRTIEPQNLEVTNTPVDLVVTVPVVS